MKMYAVIGLGRFGTQLAESLYDYGEDVLAIDVDEALVNGIAERVSRAVTADAKNKDVLKSLGVPQCDCAIVALGSDLAASVLVTMNLKSLGVPQIICKAHDDTHKEILEALGADMVIIPERVVAEKTARSLVAPNILEHIELSDDYGIVECSAPQSWEGKTIRELNIRAKYGVNIIAVRLGEEVNVSPSADYTIDGDSTLVLLGEYKSLNQIKKIR